MTFGTIVLDSKTTKKKWLIALRKTYNKSSSYNKSFNLDHWEILLKKIFR